MISIIFTIVVFLSLVFFGAFSLEASFILSVCFLFAWHCAMTGVYLLSVIIKAINVTAERFATLRSPTPDFARILYAGLTAFQYFNNTAFCRVLILGGIYIILRSGTPEMHFSEFSILKIFLGTIFFIVGYRMSIRCH